jgi:hypothetical protein
MSFDRKYGDRLQKIREAAAAAIGQLDQLRSIELTPGETFDAEVAALRRRSCTLTDAISLFIGRMMA